MAIPIQFTIAREGIAPSVSQEYIEFIENLDFGQERDTLVLGRNLYDRVVSLRGKKEALVRLAERGTPEAYEIIEEYLKTAEGELKEWGVLALWECWMAIEAEMFDEEAGMVITGLGGEGRRLRYFVAIGFGEGVVVTDDEREGIEGAFDRVCKELGSIVEGLEMAEGYVGMRLLIPMDVAVAKVVEQGIAECNEDREVLDSRHYVTNVRIPETEEIQTYLLKMGFGSEAAA